jgi:hypothetical protein
MESREDKKFYPKTFYLFRIDIVKFINAHFKTLENPITVDHPALTDDFCQDFTENYENLKRFVGKGNEYGWMNIFGLKFKKFSEGYFIFNPIAIKLQGEEQVNFIKELFHLRFHVGSSDVPFYYSMTGINQHKFMSIKEIENCSYDLVDCKDIMDYYEKEKK